jgi:hypothetical protein
MQVIHARYAVLLALNLISNLKAAASNVSGFIVNVLPLSLYLYTLGILKGVYHTI